MVNRRAAFAHRLNEIAKHDVVARLFYPSGGDLRLNAYDFKSADFLSVPSEIAFARPHGFDLAARTDDGHDIANLNAFILAGTDVHVVFLREHELLLLFYGADDASARIDRSFLNKSCAVKIVTAGDAVRVGRRSGNG
jgi:hypothetical protein